MVDSLSQFIDWLNNRSQIASGPVALSLLYSATTPPALAETLVRQALRLSGRIFRKEQVGQCAQLRPDYRRFRRWSANGIWESVAVALAETMAESGHYNIDSTTVRAHEREIGQILILCLVSDLAAKMNFHLASGCDMAKRQVHVLCCTDDGIQRRPDKDKAGTVADASRTSGALAIGLLSRSENFRRIRRCRKERNVF